MEKITTSKIFSTIRLIVLMTICTVALMGGFISCKSPDFQAKLIRRAFSKEGKKVNDALAPYVLPSVASITNERYDADFVNTGYADALLDVYYNVDSVEVDKPTIVWVHGGAWIAGSKDEVANYCKVLAGEGYTVVAINYGLAPKYTYPTPVRQLNDALLYLLVNADRLHINTSRIVLAGDSGGAQIAAQMANITTSPSYATLMDIRPTLDAEQLVATMLYCGAYDLEKADLNGDFGKFLKIVLWSYSGTKEFMNDRTFAPASVVNYITPRFPPTFISVGNNDPLEQHSRDLSTRLLANNVLVSTLFYPKDHQPPLGHEYQFDLKTTDGRWALMRSIDFLEELSTDKSDKK